MSKPNINGLEETIQKEHHILHSIFTEMEKVVVGQQYLLERIVIGLIANGHVLIEGVPGLAKTLAARTFASLIQAKFQRIQFTPDMLPADLIGTPVYIAQTGTFTTKKGPVFTNFLLADEINRAPAKVQSALLEVMEEKQVTIGETTYKLDEPFMVLATQNPIEHDGTYSLPESQLDRFMLKVQITYPVRNDEHQILKNMATTSRSHAIQPIMTPAHVLNIRKLVDEIYLEEKIEHYLLDIIEATRQPEKFQMENLKGLIEYGASPRATLNLALAAKANAFLRGRSYVTPQDIQDMAKNVLSHRIIRTYRADAEGYKSEDLVQKILDYIPIP